jgi:hypothetical protein
MAGYTCSYGKTGFSCTAPVNLVYVADLAKRGVKEGQPVTDTDLLSSWANTGFMCSERLPLVHLGGIVMCHQALIPREKLEHEMGLKPLQKIYTFTNHRIPGAAVNLIFTKKRR